MRDMKSEMNRVKRSINKIMRNKNTQKFRLRHVPLPLIDRSIDRFVKTTQQISTKPGWRTSLGSEQTSLTLVLIQMKEFVLVGFWLMSRGKFVLWSRLIGLKEAVGSGRVKLFLGSLRGNNCEDHQNFDPTSLQSDSLWLVFIIANVRSVLSPAHTSFRLFPDGRKKKKKEKLTWNFIYILTSYSLIYTLFLFQVQFHLKLKTDPNICCISQKQKYSINY